MIGILKHPAAKTALGGVAGGGLGLLYYVLIGCRTGTCPLTSTILGTILYGTVIGVLIAQLFQKSRHPR